MGFSLCHSMAIKDTIPVIPKAVEYSNNMQISADFLLIEIVTCKDLVYDVLEKLYPTVHF
jgi:hypothetical protein